MAISTKSTKAEIFQEYQRLLAESEARVITAPMLRNTARIVAIEAVELALDLARLSNWAKRQVLNLVEIYNKPLLRTR